MKFYIAASTSKREEVIELQNKLIAKGHTISYDWAHLHKPIKPYLENQTLAKKYAIDDIQGVLSCDIFVLLMSDAPGIGSTTEVGMAIALFEKTTKPQIYIVGERKKLSSNMFYYYPNIIHKPTSEELLKLF